MAEEGRSCQHDAEPGWGIYRWEPPVERRAQTPRGSGVCAFARRLMARERRRMLRPAGPLDRRPRTASL